MRSMTVIVREDWKTIGSDWPISWRIASVSFV